MWAIHVIGEFAKCMSTILTFITWASFVYAMFDIIGASAVGAITLFIVQCFIGDYSLPFPLIASPGTQIIKQLRSFTGKSKIAALISSVAIGYRFCKVRNNTLN